MIEATIDFDALKNKEFVVKAEYDAELLGNVSARIFAIFSIRYRESITQWNML